MGSWSPVGTSIVLVRVSKIDHQFFSRRPGTNSTGGLKRTFVDITAHAGLDGTRGNSHSVHGFKYNLYIYIQNWALRPKFVFFNSHNLKPTTTMLQFSQILHDGDSAGSLHPVICPQSGDLWLPDKPRPNVPLLWNPQSMHLSK